MVICDIITGHTWTFIVIMYLPPSTIDYLPDFEESLQIFKGLYSIVPGDLNMDLENAWRLRSQRVADLLT